MGLRVEVRAHHCPWRRQAERLLHQRRIIQFRALRILSGGPSCSSLAPRSLPSRTLRAAQARWPPAILDRGCARHLGVVRPGRRNGPFRPNQETPQVVRTVTAGKGSPASTHAKQRGGLNFDRHRQLTQKLLPNFLERKSGAIISLSGNLEPEVVNAAMVAKAGLVVWSKGLSEQVGKHGITVNCVQPGLIDTAQIRRLYPGDERRKFAEREIALRDFGKPQDVANAVTFLASSRARYITGTVLLVDGGMRRYSF